MPHYYPPGMPRSLDYPAAVVPDLLHSAARMYGERTAVVDGEQTTSYVRLLDEAQSIGSDLAAHGIGPGDVVALHLPNGLPFFAAYYGALSTGAAVTLVNPLQPAAALEHQLREVGAVALVTHPAHLVQAREALERLGLRRVLIARPTEAAAADETQLAAARALVERTEASFLDDVVSRPAPTFTGRRASPDDVAHLAFTGGTTGRPKAVRVLHRNVIANVLQMCAWRLSARVTQVEDGLLDLAPIQTLGTPFVVPGASSTIQVPPLFHAQGLVSCGAFILGGVTIVLPGRFDAARVVRLANQWEARYVSGNPPMFLALSAHCRATGESMPTIRLAICGAAPLDRVMMERISAAMPNARFGEGYGLTEGTCLVTASPVVPGSRLKPGSVGVTVPDTEIQIRSSDGVTVLADGEEGEIWVRGPQVTDGYSNAPEQTAEQYVDGWLRTGDVASRDEDGFIRVHDRAKDMLIYKGYNVYPRELEDVASGHPDVAQVAVVSRTVSDAGEIPVAFAVPQPGRVLDGEGLMAYVAARVLPYQRIREVHVVDELPVSAAGKILKSEIRKALA
jgi:long-chain acyl-CoA synthetase